MMTKDFELPFAPDTYVSFVSGFVLEAGNFQSKIEIRYGGKQLDGKSFLGLMNAGIPPRTRFTLQVEGSDEQQALAQISAYIEKFR